MKLNLSVRVANQFTNNTNIFGCENLTNLLKQWGGGGLVPATSEKLVNLSLRCNFQSFTIRIFTIVGFISSVHFSDFFYVNNRLWFEIYCNR